MARRNSAVRLSRTSVPGSSVGAPGPAPRPSSAAALFAESAGSVLYGPAALARTPEIVGTGPVLASANSLNAVADGTVRLIGGPLGGVLLALLGIKWL
ncbi:MAG TPA: hypothetical protein VIX15_04160, partial [Streptosporangiaceae bacterium]